MMAKSIEVIATLKGITTQEAANTLTRNTKLFYDL
ncbi:DNAase OS=Lysinibacillus sphaericus OX=1421 GN=LS41612_12475 PE=3 SV=1 [Lysinibacillus sphaericus]